jgi:CBS domain containing-hemolysin-like protein
MAMLFWIVVILLLILTGAILPILHFGLWALLVVLALTLVVWAFLRLCGFVLRPFVWLGSDMANAVRGPDHPKPNDLDYKHLGHLEK